MRTTQVVLVLVPLLAGACVGAWYFAQRAREADFDRASVQIALEDSREESRQLRERLIALESGGPVDAGTVRSIGLGVGNTVGSAVGNPAGGPTGNELSAQDQARLSHAASDLIINRLVELAPSWTDFAPLLLAADNAASLDDAAQKRVLTWLRERSADGDLPTLFLISRIHDRAGRAKDAQQYYMAAQVTAIVDAERFEERNIRLALGTFQREFQGVQDGLRADSNARRDAVRFALQVEQEIERRRPALWMGRLGKDAPTDGSPKLLDEGDWKKRREELRTMFAKTADQASAPARQVMGPVDDLAQRPGPSPENSLAGADAH